MKQDNLDNIMVITEKALNEATVTGDISQFPDLLSKITYKVYSDSLVGEIADVQPMTGPTGKIATLFAIYGGTQGSGIELSNSIVLNLASATGYVVGGPITTAAAVGVVEYIEGNDILVKITSGTFVAGASTTVIITTIVSAISNRIYAERIFSNYSGIAVSLEAITPKTIDFQVVQKNLEAKSRKIKSIFSQEAIDDLKNIYGVKVAEEMIVNEFANEIIQEIDKEIIQYLRTIATPSSDVILANSYGTQGDIMALGNDIYANIFAAGLNISRKTKRKQHFFVIGDPTSIALLKTNPLHLDPEVDKENSYYMGRLGSFYHLYMDPYTTENYILVGYTDGKNGTGNSGLFYAPYVNSITEAVDPESGQTHFHNLVRYAFTAHPQDTGTGAADSIFFRTFKVNAAGITNFPILN